MNTLQFYKLDRKLLKELNSYWYNIEIRLNNRKNFYKVLDKNNNNSFLYDPYENINEFLMDYINYNKTWYFDRSKYRFFNENLFKKN